MGNQKNTSGQEKEHKQRKDNCRVMPIDDYNKIFEELSAAFPKLFIKGAVLLLKVGIFQDIVNCEKVVSNNTRIRKFLHTYCASKDYKELHIEEAKRYDIAGEEAGIVTDNQVKLLKENLELRKLKIAEKKQKKIAAQKIEEVRSTIQQIAIKEIAINLNQNNKLEPNINSDRPKLDLKT
ncbi:MAG: ProP effector [Candidatus Midichloriaceae bacterium]|jgi:ProP effector